MRVRGEIDFGIDDEDWDFRDLFRAYEESLIDEDEDAILYLRKGDG